MSKRFYTTPEFIVGAGDVVTFPYVGNYLRCLETNLTEYSVELDNGARGTMNKGLGVEWPSDEVFKNITIDNKAGASQLTTTLGVGFGNLSDSRLNISGTVTIDDGGGSITVDGGVSVSNFPVSQTVSGTVDIGEASSPVGASFYNGFEVATGVYTMFTAAANTGGAILRTGAVSVNGATARIFADTVAPVSYADLTVKAILAAWSSAIDKDVLQREVFIPAGSGLFMACNGVAASTQLTWDML